MIVPYFGRFPDYFPLWLRSCGCNPDVDFLVFTDDRSPFAWPDNVKVTYLEWRQMQEKIRRCFDFPVAIEHAYKLCDYRPAFGEIFSGELAGYDFWGHCDLDVIWGALREFVTEDLLERYDKLFYRGHFSLYRNTGPINRLYRTEAEGAQRYREVFQDSAGRIFDEWTGIGRIFDARHIPVYDAPVVADICSDYYHFVVNSDRQEKERPQVFLWRRQEGKGRLFRYYRDENDVIRQEFMYIHLQKREMCCQPDVWEAEAFLIVPNEFAACDGMALMLDDPETEDEAAAALIRKFHRKRRVNWPLLRKKYKKKIRKICGIWKKAGR